MIRATAIDLIAADTESGVFDIPQTETKRRVFAEVRSVGYREFYLAQEQGLEPTHVFRLTDYAEYKNEPYLDYDGVRYRIIRTYTDGQTIELTAERGKVGQ